MTTKSSETKQLWNKKYPIPNRSNHTPQQDSKRDFFPEIDIGRGVAVLNDGRPATVELWYDCDCELHCRTAFYSTLEIEDWTEAQHLEYLTANGILTGKKILGDGVGLTKFPDASGNEVWSVTAAWRAED